MNLLFGAIAAILFYFLAVWILGLINLAIPNIVLALIAVLIFLGFITGKISV